MTSQPENPFSTLPQNQKIALIPSFTLESGETLNRVPVAYKTWGELNEAKDNVMIICHALTGSADVADWWGPLLGPGKAFDTSKFFIFCGNVLGSPYGSASPCTLNSQTNMLYGPEFPQTTIRDDIRIHKLVLDWIGISQVAIVIGGSLGGMQALEWAMLGSNYVKTLVAIATCGKHSAWGISWGEAQRQAIFSDPKFRNGHYPHDDPPKSGLSAARMSALLTYRSRNSFESRFGRKQMIPKSPSLPKSENGKNPEFKESQVFSAQSYLRYQGEKFVSRFDANCYIAITQKMDYHDVSAGRGSYHQVLATISQPSMIIGIESDGLFTISEQYELAEHIPKAEMHHIDSPDGHDGFLLEFEQLNRHLRRFIKKELPGLYGEANSPTQKRFIEEVKQTSLFGETEGDLIEW